MSWWLNLLALAVVWLQLIGELQTDWALNPQYAYGYMVPLLAVGLIWRRWSDRPAAAGNDWRWLVTALMGTFLLLPVRLVEEANPEWRMFLWLHAGLVVGVTLAFAGWHGGRKWLKHFGFAICFLAVSVPWPMFLEKGLIHGLMRVVAGVVVELAGIVGMPVVQHGNVIEVSSGLVGVDEACSGVRSLQTTFMAALFFGEVYRMNGSRRLGLLLVGAALAFLANIGRTYYLVWTAAHQGFDVLHRVHDGAGIAAMAVILPALALVAWRWQSAPPIASASSSDKLVPIQARYCLALVGLVVGAEVVTESWYRSHESQVQARRHWSINWPTNRYAFADAPLSDTARAMLRCDQGRGVTWTDSEANQWQLFFLQWEPGRNSAQLAKGHTPEICLPSSGWKLVQNHGQVQLEVRGLSLPFRQYEFQSGGRTLHVFYCLWENRPNLKPENLLEDGTLGSRWQAVRFGIRHLGQQVLELALEGPRTAEDSRIALQKQLPEIVSF